MVGRRVQITDLTKTPEFNGQWGKATDAYWSDTGENVQLELTAVS